MDRIPQYLIERAKNGDERAIDQILTMVEPVIRRVTRNYRIVGQSQDDLIQICRLAVWRAIPGFDPSKSSFVGFVGNIVVPRRMTTLVAHAYTHQESIINKALITTQVRDARRDANIDDQDGDLLESTVSLDPPVYDQVVEILEQEEARETIDEYMEQCQQSMTALEFSVWQKYLECDGGSYRAVADALGCNSKCVDNCLARGKPKSAAIIDKMAQARKDRVNLN